MANKATLVYDASAEIADGDGHNLNDPHLETMTSLSSYVLWKAQEWTDFIESNFYSQWDEYYRLWRGLWDGADKTRDTERSRIVTPALQQAVESSVAEVEEATFGQGYLFDIRDDVADQDPMDIAILRQKLDEEFRKNKIRTSVAEVLINAAVYGTGVAEVVLDEITDMKPATESVMDGQMESVGVRWKKRPVVKMKPIQMKNFIIDPVATSVDDAHGCAIDEFVPMHMVEDLQRKGVYRDVYVGTAPSETDIEPNQELDTFPYSDKVRLLKYFGLVPRHLLRLAQGGVDEDEKVIDLVEPEAVDTNEDYWVEAIVVIANDGVLLKAEENPYMMKDRPIVAFQWDVVPALFWGRGICEKGYNSQKALDAEIRARIDALALTIHPMLAMDATRIPRGHVPQVRPGKMLLTNGKPSDVLEQFQFGNVSQITFAQAAELQKMVQQSTGAVDATGLPGTVNGEATAAGVSMSLGAIIKRQKRTLVHFHECFWLPFVEKAAWRYMQFDPENWPIDDYKFVPSSTLGIMAREYEVTQLVQLLQTTSDQSPMYGALIEAIVENMNLSNREELIKVLREAAQPDPQEVQMQQQMHQMQMQLQQAQIAYAEAQAHESRMRGEKYRIEAELEPQKLEIDRIDAVADVRDNVTSQEFQQRLQIAEVKLSERKLNIEEKKIDLEDKRAQAEAAASAELDSLTE
jgi:hypothetical protein